MWLLWADTSPYVWNKRDSEWWELLLFATAPPINVETSFCLRQYLYEWWITPIISNKSDFKCADLHLSATKGAMNDVDLLLFATTPTMNDETPFCLQLNLIWMMYTTFYQQQKQLRVCRPPFVSNKRYYVFNRPTLTSYKESFSDAYPL